MIRLSPANSKKLTTALQSLWESVEAADGDLCGEVREWHLPRLRSAALTLTELFPNEAVAAIEKAKSPYDA